MTVTVTVITSPAKLYACDDCGRIPPVLVVTDYGCCYCRACLRPDLEVMATKQKKSKPEKESTEMNYEAGES